MITLTVNGTPRQLDVAPEMPLLWALRETLELTGTKYALRHGALRRLHGPRRRHSRPAPASRRCRRSRESR